MMQKKVEKAGQGKKKRSDQKTNQNQDSTRTSRKSIKHEKKPKWQKKAEKKTLQDRPQNRKGIDTNTEQKRDICHAVNRNNNQSNRICFPGLRQRDAKSSSVVPRVSHMGQTRDSAAGRGTFRGTKNPSIQAPQALQRP
jgi:hypothetical protein